MFFFQSEWEDKFHTSGLQILRDFFIPRKETFYLCCNYLLRSHFSPSSTHHMMNINITLVGAPRLWCNTCMLDMWWELGLLIDWMLVSATTTTIPPCQNRMWGFCLGPGWWSTRSPTGRMGRRNWRKVQDGKEERMWWRPEGKGKAGWTKERAAWVAWHREGQCISMQEHMCTVVRHCSTGR